MILKDLVNKGLSQIEAVTYLLVNSGMTYRELGGRLGVSHTAVQKWYVAGEKKVQGEL